MNSNDHSIPTTSKCLNFISCNPATEANSISKYPDIDKTAFIGTFSSIIGDVRINKEVYVANNVTIRADEGTPFYIGNKTNIQDGVIMHGLKNNRFLVNNVPYSIYIGNEVSIAHGVLIHGPCIIGTKTFVGFNSIVFNAIVEDGCYIDLGAIIMNGVCIAERSYIPAKAIIDTQDKADKLEKLGEDNTKFAENVNVTNVELAYAYNHKLGNIRCSCGIGI